MRASARRLKKVTLVAPSTLSVPDVASHVATRPRVSSGTPLWR